MKRINLEFLFRGVYLKTRGSAKKLFSEIDILEDDNIELDFSGIKLVSISFSQQFNVELLESKKHISIINTNPFIKTVLEKTKMNEKMKLNKNIAYSC